MTPYFVQSNLPNRCQCCGLDKKNYKDFGTLNYLETILLKFFIIFFQNDKKLI